ncbi:MAG: efflux RND transporter periplasmic adaptor subunit [Acidobacteriota bacterium]|jgi:cobalt-zinc-cadmium efflux system membrane fusion protein|nr:efflux RND transporter periplasmic adaptor subunit [Acidobacteriota bacterium]
MNDSKRWAALLLMLFVAGSMLPSCSHEIPEETGEDEQEEGGEQIPDGVELSEEANAALGLVFGTVERRSLDPLIEVPAELMPVPDRQATVGPRVAGRVVQVRVNVGDRVRRGSPLLVLESADVGEARADFVADQAKAEVALRAAERARGLLESRVTSERAVEEAEGNLRQAQADLEAARTRLLSYGADPNHPHREQPGQVVLTSPIGGTVVERTVHVGQWVEPGDSVLGIIDLTELWLAGSVYEGDLQQVQEGQHVVVEIRALPEERFQGEVAYLADRLDPESRTAALRVVMPNADHRLRPGMFATAQLAPAATEARQVVAVPASALQDIEGRPFVFIPDGETSFLVRWVQVGASGGEWTEIIDGLVPGERLVTRGGLLLKAQLLRSTLGEDE